MTKITQTPHADPLDALPWSVVERELQVVVDAWDVWAQTGDWSVLERAGAQCQNSLNRLRGEIK